MLPSRILDYSTATSTYRLHYYDIGELSANGLSYVALQSPSVLIEYVPLNQYTHRFIAQRFDYNDYQNATYVSIGTGAENSIDRDAVIPSASSQSFYIVIGESRQLPGVKKLDNHPCYFDLMDGYELDSRIIPSEPTITSSTDKKVTLKYYQRNTLESLPNLRSICWRVFECELKANIPFKLPIKDIVLGTLHGSDSTVLALITATPTLAGCYPFSALLPSSINDLFQAWNTLYDNQPFNSSNELVHPQVITLRKLAANNNVWNNSNLANNLDINFDITHPMFAIDSQRAYDWHISPQSNNNGIGTLIMDSPRTIEIHTALNASNYLIESPAVIGTGTPQNPQTPALHKLDWYIKNGNVGEKLTQVWKALEAWKYSFNDIDDSKMRVSNLGYLIENIARVLGIRVNANGEIDHSQEKQHYQRSIVNNPIYDKRAYSTNCFGKYGRLTPHLSNSNGKEAWDKFADIPQMLEALAEHQNRSLGIQQGTEIKLKNAVTGKEDYYPNQLAIMIDMLAKLQEIQLNSKEGFNLLSVMSYELREMWSGIGIPVLYRKIYTRYGSLFSLAHQTDKGSINTSLTTLKINIGMILGSFFQRPKDIRHPLEKIFSKPDKK